MCLRSTLKKIDRVALPAGLNDTLPAADADWTPHYNVALTSLMPVITQQGSPNWRD